MSTNPFFLKRVVSVYLLMSLVHHSLDLGYSGMEFLAKVCVGMFGIFVEYAYFAVT